MKKIILLLILTIFVLSTVGCGTEKRILFENRHYKDVYNATLQFITVTGWEIRNSDRVANLIYSKIGDTMGFQVSISFVFYPEENNTEVFIKAIDEVTPLMSWWNPDVTIEEYIEYVEKYAPQSEAD